MRCNNKLRHNLLKKNVFDSVLDTRAVFGNRKRKSAIAIKSAEDFLQFREYVCEQKNVPHMDAWHREINTGIDGDYLKGIKGPDISILAPRGSAKSTWLCQWLAWCIGYHLNRGIALKIVYISYVIDVAAAKSRQIKSILESPRYQEVFPLVRAGKVKWGEREWQIDLSLAGLRTIDEPYTLVCSGLLGAIVSKRAHLIIFDDLIKTKSEAGNRILQDRMVDNYNNGIKYIRFPESRIINLGTRFAKHDIYNRIFVYPYYKIIKQSALITDSNGNEKSFWEPQSDDDKFGYPLTVLQKERDTDYESFLLQRQNEIPQDVTEGINKEAIVRDWLPSQFEQIYLGLDLAGSVQKYSDRTAITVLGIHKGILYVCDAWEEKLKGNYPKIKLLYKYWERWKTKSNQSIIVAIDANKYSSLFKQDLEIVLDDLTLLSSTIPNIDNAFNTINIADIATSGRGKEKIDRLNSHSTLFDNKRIIFNKIEADCLPSGVPPLDKLIAEITDYNSNESNDLLDSLETAIYEARKTLGEITVA